MSADSTGDLGAMAPPVEGPVAESGRAAGSGIAAWFRRHALATDLLLLGGVLIVAGVLRFTLLGDVPYGLHPDEAQVGTDAARILDGHPIGPYTSAALGQPSGHAYLATPFVAVMGHEILAIRLPLTIIALLAVPLLYALARVALGRTEAVFASLLLATSYWHLLYSRVAHWSISYATVAVAIALCMVLALQRRSRRWMVAAGVLTGLGVYTYNIYAIAVVALAVAGAIITVVCVPAADRRWWLRSAALAAVVAFVISLPMIIVVANPDSKFWDHANGYGNSGLLRSDEFLHASSVEKARLAATQAKSFAATYTYNANVDLVDGNGLRAVFDPITLALLAGGLVLAWRRRTNPAVIIAICCMVIIPLPAVLQRGSVMRQPIAAAPFAMLIVALPLAWAWHAPRTVPGLRPATRIVAMCAVSAITLTTVHDYFWTWRNASSTTFVYHAEVTSAALYMRHLPDDAYVYFYSDRHPLSIETVGFLAPHVEGENRSNTFAPAVGGSIDGIRRDRPAVFVILEPYISAGLITQVQAEYPGGRLVIGDRDGRAEFFGYELPASTGSVAPP